MCLKSILFHAWIKWEEIRYHQLHICAFLDIIGWQDKRWLWNLHSVCCNEHRMFMWPVPCDVWCMETLASFGMKWKKKLIIHVIPWCVKMIMSRTHTNFVKLEWMDMVHVALYWKLEGRGNSTVVSISICEAGCPGLSLARSISYRKVEFYLLLLTCSHQCRRLVHQRPSMCYHVYVVMHVKDP